jgi:hypothetical protein
MDDRSTSIHEISFQLSRRNERAEIPLSLWTDLVFDGQRVIIRTRRPVALLKELCDSAEAEGTELPGIVVQPVDDVLSREPPSTGTA